MNMQKSLSYFSIPVPVWPLLSSLVPAGVDSKDKDALRRVDTLGFHHVRQVPYSVFTKVEVESRETSQVCDLHFLQGCLDCTSGLRLERIWAGR